MDNCKLLIASNGKETRVLFNGVQLPAGHSFTFSVKGGESPKMDIDGISIYNHPPHTEEDFIENVERMIGYRVRPLQKTDFKE